MPGQGSYTTSSAITNSKTTNNIIEDRSVESIADIAHGQEESSGLPIRLKIPKINVDTDLEYVGLTSRGAVGVPKNPSRAAWYNLGPRPGEKGNAVITGHINWYYGVTGVFAELHHLKPGDKITVQDDTGAVTDFVVRKSQSYNASANAVDVFISNDKKSHLNLITCEGVWNKYSKSYSKRLVVFADKE